MNPPSFFTKDGNTLFLLGIIFFDWQKPERTKKGGCTSKIFKATKENGV